MKQKMKQTQADSRPIEFNRADPEQLAKFDDRSKVCTMNCGPYRDDPRDSRELKFLCDECLIRKVPKQASSIEMRKALEIVEMYKKAGILFVPIPAINEKDHTELVTQAAKKLEEIESLCD